MPQDFKVIDRRPSWMKYDDEMPTQFGQGNWNERDKDLEQAARTPYHDYVSRQSVDELCRLREENTYAGRSFRFDEQDELLDERARLGTRIQDVVFLERFNKILQRERRDRAACFTVSAARVGGRIQYTVGVACIVPTERGGEMKSVCQVQPGVMPEYSILRVDIHQVPLNEKYRGWRTVLLRAICSGVITEQQAHEEFGEALGMASRRYRQQLFSWRNR